MFFWSCDAGLVEDDFGNLVRGLDVLIYETEDDMDADTDNTLAICRETVIDDREAIVEDGEATAQDAEGCTVTAVLVGQ